jgi:signal transduction histidine kinase
MRTEGQAHGLVRFAKQLLPQSLFGRLVLILLAGLIVTQLAGILIFAREFTRERETLSMNVQLEQAERRVAELTRVLDRTPRAERANLAKVLSTRAFRVTLEKPAILPEADAGDTRVDDFRKQLTTEMQPSTLMVAAIVDAKSVNFERRPPSGASLESVPPSPPVLRTVVQLSDQSWVVYDLVIYNRSEPRAPTMRIALDLGLRVIIILAACLIAVRVATQPLMALGRAATELGRNLNAPPMPETGSAEIRSAAHAFNDMQKKLQAFIEERTRMLAAVSHDLKTPITRMRLRSEQIDDEKLRLKFEQDLKEMESLVSGTLAFMRNLEVEKSERQPVDLHALIESLIEDRAEAGQMIELKGEISKPVMAYPQSIKRGIDNLIDNALKYGDKVKVELTQTANETRIAVMDEGPGIPETELEKVFEPFYRLEASRNKDTGGNGLGLSISRNIARAHGGDIVLANLKPQGLKATLVLPG